MKKLVLVLLLVFVFAIPALANPFVDVPLTHWAYDAVQTLAAKGVVIGYPDGTFGGQRTLTRYEFAEATARLLAYVEQYGGIREDVEILSKLAVEFADELANLGVTVADLEAVVGEHSEAIAALKAVVDKHEKFFDPVKITGSWKADYSKEVYDLSGDPVN
ncbi:MAG TPA: S-layer homology domain-containing protein, partial [Atribacterota bacterium]|nr:S-layer homology domain-containing protein [Atribacterota bacterium]